MFARKVSMHLKSSVPSSPRSGKGSPSLLRKQKDSGRNHICRTGRKGSICISLWDQAENAESYNRGAYAEVAKPWRK